MIPTLLALTLTLHSCSKPILSNNAPAENLIDVAYGDDPKQKMDIYLPGNRNTDSTKLVLVIHGGGWNGGDKAELAPYISELQKRLPGFAFANINYRLFNFNTGKNRFPVQEDDIKNALAFLNRKSSEYKISTSTVLLGTSAGAHLALLQGYKNSTPGKTKAIISFFGPTDLIELYNNPGNPGIPMLLSALTGTNPAENKSLYEQSSPTHFVSTNSPPTLILQGGRDMLVPENQAVLLKNKLQTMGVPHQYIYYPGEAHGWRGKNLDDSLDKIARFLQQYAND